MESRIADITHVIQLSVAPAFLLVAIGNLLMILSARLGRIVDRRRVLEDRLGGLSGDAAAGIETELAHLNRRAALIYFATLSAVLGALAVCLVVAGAFLGALLEVEMKLAEGVAGLFVLAMISMLVSWSLLLREVYLTIRVGAARLHR
jgi:hypothetical protein